MITHVAIFYKGKVYSLPKPCRHHDVIRLISRETGEQSLAQNEQGFLDDKGRFLRRKPALIHAQECGQILPGAGKFPQLYSEDVW
jgi:hypothetical protein